MRIVSAWRSALPRISSANFLAVEASRRAESREAPQAPRTPRLRPIKPPIISPYTRPAFPGLFPRDFSVASTRPSARDRRISSSQRDPGLQRRRGTHPPTLPEGSARSIALPRRNAAPRNRRKVDSARREPRMSRKYHRTPGFTRTPIHHGQASLRCSATSLKTPRLAMNSKYRSDIASTCRISSSRDPTGTSGVDRLDNASRCASNRPVNGRPG